MNTIAKPMGKPSILVAGYGAAGKPFADGFGAAGAQVLAVDSRAENPSEQIVLRGDLPGDLTEFDLIVSIVPASNVPDLMQEISRRPGTAPVLDLSSSDAKTMQAVAGLLPSRLVDGVILGAVGMTGHRTPVVLAGEASTTVEALLAPLGCQITVLENGAIGDAGKLKLLRSILTKGLEALVVELHISASVMGLEPLLPLALKDLETLNFNDFMREMLRTHPRHAGRRHIEVTQARDSLAALNLPSPMSDAAIHVFARTKAAGVGPDGDLRTALDWLLPTIEA